MNEADRKLLADVLRIARELTSKYDWRASPLEKQLTRALDLYDLRATERIA